MKRVFLIAANNGIPFDANGLHQFVINLHMKGQISEWWHYIPGPIYLVKTNLDTNQINSLFFQHMNGLQYLLIKVDPSEVGGFLPPEAWNWINSG